MSNTKIYTKTGDKGNTSLLDGTRVPKSSIYPDTLGSMDELTSRIGILCASLKCTEDPYLIPFLRDIQSNLQRINSYIATNDKTLGFLANLEGIDSVIEDEIDRLQVNLPTLTKFILPGVTISDAHAHSCRTQARTAERRLRKYQEEVGGMPDVTLKYINRLSDYFFVLARHICNSFGETDCFM